MGRRRAALLILPPKYRTAASVNMDAISRQQALLDARTMRAQMKDETGGG